MRWSCVLVVMLALGCESPIEDVPIRRTRVVDAEAAPAPEVEVVPEVVEQVPEDAAASIPVSEAAPRVGSIVTKSARYVGYLRRTPVQRAETFHPHRFPRWAPEARIIQADPSLEDPQRLIDLTVLVLARIGVSEANWKATPWESADGRSDRIGELPRLYQVIRTQRRPGETLINTMRNFSRIVSEMWAPSRRRERWLTQLDLEGSYPPSFTEDERSWEQLYRERWMEALALARDLVYGRVNGRPCAGPLRAWGGRCDVEAGACDDPIARGRGLVPIETCGGENRYWGHPRRLSYSTVIAEVQLARSEERPPEPQLLERIEAESPSADLGGRPLRIE